MPFIDFTKIPDMPIGCGDFTSRVLSALIEENILIGSSDNHMMMHPQHPHMMGGGMGPYGNGHPPPHHHPHMSAAAGGGGGGGYQHHQQPPGGAWGAAQNDLKIESITADEKDRNKDDGKSTKVPTRTHTLFITQLSQLSTQHIIPPHNIPHTCTTTPLIQQLKLSFSTTMMFTHLLF